MTPNPTQATPQLQIGQWVRSIPVGRAPSFVGEIIERCEHDNTYVVRDYAKRRWWRGYEQLEEM